MASPGPLVLLLPLLLLLFLSSFPRFAPAQRNDKPVIGVLAMGLKVPRFNQTSYIAASYVKHLEGGGAKVVPIMINEPMEKYRKLFRSLNGIIFPGGSASLYSSSYARAASFFYQLALEANSRGDYFPLWGTCLGFEMLAMLTSNKTVLTRTDTKGVAMILNTTQDAAEGRMFQNVPSDLMKVLSSEPLSVHAHKWSLSTETLESNEQLKSFYKVLSINFDGKVEFVSTMEAYDYPIYATQWHPEKNPYEWRKDYVPHSPPAVRMSFYFSEFFINEARKSQHRFDSEEEERKHLIYNFSPIQPGAASVFDQIYVFNN